MRALQFIILISMCLIFLTFAFAQEKNAALKFDEFTYDPQRNFKNPSFNIHVIRFAKEVLKEKDSKAYIIFYNQRKGEFPLDKGSEWNKSALEFITNNPYSFVNPKYQVPSERVISIDGGYREYATLEFWIVPPNAKLPKPTPTFDKSEIAVCPQINVAGDGFQHDRKLPLNFSVAIKGVEPNLKLSLEWNVSAGKIIAGQGTNQIKIDLSETNAKQITASVQVRGLNPECDNYSFGRTEVGTFPYKIDEFPFVLYSELSARFDGLMVYVHSEPSMTGYIIIYGPREGLSRTVPYTIQMIKRLMAFRQYDASRVKIVEGGFREEGMIEFYLLPKGIEAPKPTPTVDEKFVIFTDKLKQKKANKRK